MRLVFLGTGAADWTEMSPDSEYRRFSSLLVDDQLLIDCTPAAVKYMHELDVDMAGIHDVLITHSHADHFNANALAELAKYGGVNVYIESSWAAKIRIPGAKIAPITPGEPLYINQYKILPLRANHRADYPDEITLHYLIERDGLAWYYATDGAWLTTHEFHTLMLGNYRLDAWVADATIGDGHDGDPRIFEHTSLTMLREMLKTLLSTGILKQGAPILLTHMARTLHPSQAELERTLTPPFIPGYDGMQLELRIL